MSATPKSNPAQQAQDIVKFIQAMAEMSHKFYEAMILSGASPPEARAGMQAFVYAQWQEAMNAARQHNQNED